MKDNAGTLRGWGWGQGVEGVGGGLSLGKNSVTYESDFKIIII